MNNKKILLVEDDSDQVLIYQSKFELEGFFLVITNNLKKTLELAVNEKPDLILLDLLLKNENGLDILKKLKEGQETNKIPVVVFTNFDTEESKEKALQLGAVDYIVKAKVTPNEVVNEIKKIIEENKNV